MVHFNDSFAIFRCPGPTFKHDLHRQTNTKVLHFFTLLQCSYLSGNIAITTIHWQITVL